MAPNSPQDGQSHISAFPPEPVENISALSITVKQEVEIDVSHLHNTNAAFAVRCTDWDRLKAELRRAGIPGFEFLSILYPIFFGIAGTSGLSIIPIRATKDLPAWVAPFYMIVTIAALLLGLLFAWLDRKIKAVVRGDLQNIVTGMEKFESQAGTPAKEK